MSIFFIVKLARCARRSRIASRGGHAAFTSSAIRWDFISRFMRAKFTSAARSSIRQARSRDSSLLIHEYPEKFRTAAVTKHLFDAEFEISIAAKPAERGDVMYVAGCLFRAAGFMTLVLYALNRKFYLNEKGAFIESRGFSIKPPRFHDTVASVLGNVGTTPRANVDEHRQLPEPGCGIAPTRDQRDRRSSGCVLSARARFRGLTPCERARRACRTSACPWRVPARPWRVRF